MDVVNNSETLLSLLRKTKLDKEREGEGERERLPRHVRVHEGNNRWRKSNHGKKACRKVKEGGWYSERRRRQSGRLAATSYCCIEWDSRRRNSSYVSVQCHFCSAKPCMSTAMQIQREPCLRVTGSCVKLVLASVYVKASSDILHYMPFL